MSRRLDLCPEGTDNENMVVLPEHLFANLIDTELQRRIVNTENMDYDAAEAIKGLLVFLLILPFMLAPSTLMFIFISFIKLYLKVISPFIIYLPVEAGNYFPKHRW